MSEPVVLIPTREQVQSLKVGDLALSYWGTWVQVTRIFGQGDDTKGHAYVCFVTESGPTSGSTNSYKEGELVRTAALCQKYSDAELDGMEARARDADQETLMDGRLTRAMLS
jgi:hypothetical protein